MKRMNFCDPYYQGRERPVGQVVPPPEVSQNDEAGLYDHNVRSFIPHAAISKGQCYLLYT